jgi:hypothetical protein
MDAWEWGVRVLAVGLGCWVGNATFEAMRETFHNFERIKWRR